MKRHDGVPMMFAHDRARRRQRTEIADELDKLNTHDHMTLTQEFRVVNPFVQFRVKVHCGRPVVPAPVV